MNTAVIGYPAAFLPDNAIGANCVQTSGSGCQHAGQRGCQKLTVRQKNLHTEALTVLGRPRRGGRSAQLKQHQRKCQKKHQRQSECQKHQRHSQRQCQSRSRSTPVMSPEATVITMPRVNGRRASGRRTSGRGAPMRRRVNILGASGAWTMRRGVEASMLGTMRRSVNVNGRRASTRTIATGTGSVRLNRVRVR